MMYNNYSFLEVVLLFLAYLSIIDLGRFSGSLKTYIKDYNPDIVLIIYNGTMIGANINQNEHTEIWNFE